MKRLLLVLLAFGMLACAPGDLGKAMGQQVSGNTVQPIKKVGPPCAELYLQAQVSPKPVVGSWACMSKELQDKLVAGGIPAGDGFLAEDTGYSETYWYLGREHTGGYAYEVRATSGPVVLVATIIVYLDSNGKIVAARPTQQIQL